MDWTSVILAGLGGALGAAIGTLMALPFQSKSTKSTIAVVITVVGATLGGRLGPTLLEPYLGGTLRDATGQTAAAEAQLDELRNEPLFAALLDGGALTEDELRDRLLQAYREGGADGVKREGGLIGAENSDLVAAYFPLGADKNIVTLLTVMTEIMYHLADRNPDICYDWLLGEQHGRPHDAVRFGAAIGADRETQLNEALADLIRNAHDAIPEFDAAAAQAGVARAGEAAVALFTEENVGVITGARAPNDAAEAELACRGIYALYTSALTEENAADVLRLLLQG